ncbi:hypothetical protein ACFLR1_04520 [Bacteroidota bacterium]
MQDAGKKLATILWVIIGISIALHILFLVLSLIVFKDWQFEHEPAHAAIEAAGGVIALVVALWISSLHKKGHGTTYNIWIAGALTAMGLLDGFHAISQVGNSFVWLHSSATFVGGILFVLVWLPNSIHEKLPVSWQLLITALVVPFGIWSLYSPEQTPLMVVGNSFTDKARIMNLVGGVLMCAAGLRFILTWIKTKNTDDLLFCLHCILFGAAAIMFDKSALWDISWWGWHTLRIMAYIVAFWFVFRSQEQLIGKLAASEENKAFR